MLNPFSRTVSIWTLSDSGSFRLDETSFLSGDNNFFGCSDVDADRMTRKGVFSSLEQRTALTQSTHLKVDSPSDIRNEHSVSHIFKHERWNLETQGPQQRINFCFPYKALLQTLQQFLLATILTARCINTCTPDSLTR
jgi:hypothetical protein